MKGRTAAGCAHWDASPPPYTVPFIYLHVKLHQCADEALLIEQQHVNTLNHKLGCFADRQRQHTRQVATGSNSRHKTKF